MGSRFWGQLIGVVMLVGLSPALSAAPLSVAVTAKGSGVATYTLVLDEQVWSNSFSGVAKQNELDAFLVQVGRRPDNTDAAILANSETNKRLYRDFDDFVNRDLAQMQSQDQLVSKTSLPLRLNQRAAKKVVEWQLQFPHEYQRAVYIETDRAYISLVLSLTKPSKAWDAAFTRVLNALYLF